MNQNVVKNGNCSDKKGIITRCLEEELYRENILFRAVLADYYPEDDDSYNQMYDFSVYFSGENIDTIRVELSPMEEDKLILMFCKIPNVIPNGCNENALRKECDKLNFLYGEHAVFSFYENDGYEDARVIVSFEREIEEDDPAEDEIRWVTSPKDLAEFALDDARELAKIVDQAFPGLIYAAWKED